MGNPSILDELRPALRSSIAALAEDLLGPPNTQNGRELRWGAKGSFRVIISGPKQGACCDFEGGWSGDPLALIMRERHTDFIGAVKYGCDYAGIPFDRQGKQEDLTFRDFRRRLPADDAGGGICCKLHLTSRVNAPGSRRVGGCEGTPVNGVCATGPRRIAECLATCNGIPMERNPRGCGASGATCKGWQNTTAQYLPS